jgi:hypothetical protein
MNKSQTNRKKTQKKRTQKGGYERTFMYVHKVPPMDYKDNIGSVGAPIPASGYNAHIATRGGSNRARKTSKNKRKRNINIK